MTASAIFNEVGLTPWSTVEANFVMVANAMVQKERGFCQMGGFCLLVEVYRKESATSRATPSSLTTVCVCSRGETCLSSMTTPFLCLGKGLGDTSLPRPTPSLVQDALEQEPEEQEQEEEEQE